MFGNSQIGRRIVRDSSSSVVGVVFMMGDVTVEHNHRVLSYMLEMLELPDGLLANISRMLDEICSSIVGLRAQL